MAGEYTNAMRSILREIGELKTKTQRLENKVTEAISCPEPTPFRWFGDRKGTSWDKDEDDQLRLEYLDFLRKTANIHRRSIGGISSRMLRFFSEEDIW